MSVSPSRRRLSAPSARRRSRRDAIRERIRAAQPSAKNRHQWRLVIVWGLLLVGHVGLAARLVYLQGHQGDKLLARARAQQMTALAPRTRRHPIVDRHGTLLAKDEPAFRLYVHPKLFRKSGKTDTEIATAIAPIIDQPVNKLVERFGTQPTGIMVARGLSQEQAEQVRALWLDGLELESGWRRIYTQRHLFANLVGYVNADGQGQSGVEYSQQSLLLMPPPNRKVSRDGVGAFLPDHFPDQPLSAQDRTLQLTVDSRLQRSASKALKAQLQKFRARRGTVIVMDVKDGAMLALASEPSFNPDRFYEADPALFKNWAVSDLYEPGSTFKPINVAIALDAGAIKPNTTIRDEGSIQVGGWPISNYDGKGRGAISITKILEVSSNVGMVHIMERMQPTAFFDALKKIGIGEITGTDLPFETPGQFKDRHQFVTYPIEPATTAFGQGFSMTPVQLAQLHSAIANGGMLVTPHITKGILDRNGEFLEGLNLIQPRRVFTQDTADRVRDMMGSVVANGTGKSARIPGYRLGGKTGTAQKASGGRYRSGKITSFVANFPLDNPQYVVIAVVDEPTAGNAFGSTVAAPIVKEVIETLIALEGIPPSHPDELKPKPEKTP